jgi:hypothetical protein
VSVLALREDIHSLVEGGCVAITALSEAIVTLVILPQVVVESSVAVSWQVLGSESAREVRNVRVSASSIVHVDHWLGVNVGEIVRWSLLSEVKGAKIIDFAGLFGRAEASVVAMDVAVTTSSIGTVELGLGYRGSCREAHIN